MNKLLTLLVVLVCLAAAFWLYVTGPFGDGLESLPAWLGGTKPPAGAGVGESAPLRSLPTYDLSGLGQYGIRIDAGTASRIRFTAPESGVYRFTTIGEDDTIGMLYLSDHDAACTARSDDGNGRAFQIDYQLNAGQTVCLDVSYFSPTCSGTVTLAVTCRTQTGGISTSRPTATPHPTATPRLTATPRPTSGNSAQPSNWPVGETVRVYVSSGNTRTGPGMGYSWSGYVNRGCTFAVVERRLGDTGKDWYRIWHEGKYQWISSGLVEIDGHHNGTVNGVPLPNN